MITRCRFCTHALLGLLFLLCAAPTLAATCRVVPGGTGDGSDWPQASSLQSALANASCNEIWVAQGTYTPDEGSGDRSAHFAITRNLQLYGGFAGNEASLAERASTDPALTVLSGEIGDPGSRDDNSYRLLLLDTENITGGLTANTVIDGFTLRDAVGANGFPGNVGAALYCRSVRSNQPCSPTLTRLHFIDNSANNGGAIALYADCCLQPLGGIVAPTITDTVFSNNQAQTSGGAIYALAASQPSRVAPVIERSAFVNNAAHFGSSIGPGGGAIYVDAGSQGGAIDISIRDTTFAGNHTAGFYGRGGAIYNRGLGGPSKVRLDQVTFFGNTSTFQGNPDSAGQSIYAYGDQATTVIERSIVADASPFRREGSAALIDLSKTVVPPGAPCPANATCTDAIEGDPLLGPLQENGGGTPSLLPAMGGVAVDAVECGESTTDQRGISRPQGVRCDAGALEHRIRTLTLEVLGEGGVAIQLEPGGDALPACDWSDSPCTFDYGESDDPEPVFTFTATPGTNWTLEQWSGDCSVDGGNPLLAHLTLDTSKSCSVRFLPPNYTVSLGVDPIGSGTLEVQGGIDPNAVPQGTVLELVATPNPGWDVADPAAYPPIQDCGGVLDLEAQLDGTLHITTPAITADCQLVARFANQPPAFTTTAGEITALVNGAAVILPGWASAIRSGDGLDPAQTLQFQTTLIDTVPSGAQLFAPGDEPAIDTDGSLHFAPGSDSGSALFQVVLRDDAGSANGGNDISTPALLLIRIAEAGTDLSLHAEVPDTFNFPGDRVNFALRVENAGPHDASQARVQWIPPLELVNVEWFCEPQSAATCTASGTGSIDDTIDIPANGALRYLIEATLPAPSAAAIDNQALVSPGPDQADPDPSDDTITWQLRIDGLLRDGFENREP